MLIKNVGQTNFQVEKMSKRKNLTEMKEELAKLFDKFPEKESNEWLQLFAQLPEKTRNKWLLTMMLKRELDQVEGKHPKKQ